MKSERQNSQKVLKLYNQFVLSWPWDKNKVIFFEIFIFASFHVDSAFVSYLTAHNWPNGLDYSGLVFAASD